MKKTIKFGVVFSASFLSFQTLALGDDPVNCQTIIVERPVYAGFASCLAGGQVLSQNVILIPTHLNI